MKTKENLLYSKDHEWIKIEDNEGVIGITDFAQHELGEIVFVELPSKGESFTASEPFGVIESVKAASDIFLPVAGTIIAVNEELEDNPGAINETPYNCWIVKIKIEDANEQSKLMSAKAYEEFTNA